MLTSHIAQQISLPISLSLLQTKSTSHTTGFSRSRRTGTLTISPQTTRSDLWNRTGKWTRVISRMRLRIQLVLEPIKRRSYYRTFILPQETENMECYLKAADRGSKPSRTHMMIGKATKWEPIQPQRREKCRPKINSKTREISETRPTTIWFLLYRTEASKTTLMRSKPLTQVDTRHQGRDSGHLTNIHWVFHRIGQWANVALSRIPSSLMELCPSTASRGQARRTCKVKRTITSSSKHPRHLTAAYNLSRS